MRPVHDSNWHGLVVDLLPCYHHYISRIFIIIVVIACHKCSSFCIYTHTHIHTYIYQTAKLLQHIPMIVASLVLSWAAIVLVSHIPFSLNWNHPIIIILIALIIFLFHHYFLTPPGEVSLVPFLLRLPRLLHHHLLLLLLLFTLFEFDSSIAFITTVLTILPSASSLFPGFTPS